MLFFKQGTVRVLKTFEIYFNIIVSMPCLEVFSKLDNWTMETNKICIFFLNSDYYHINKPKVLAKYWIGYLTSLYSHLCLLKTEPQIFFKKLICNHHVESDIFLFCQAFAQKPNKTNGVTLHLFTSTPSFAAVSQPAPFVDQ